MLRRLVMPLLATLALMGIAVGCGSDDGGGGEADASPSPKVEFIQEANELCARSRKKLEREVTSYEPPELKGDSDGRLPSEQTFHGALMKVGLPGIQEQTDELREFASSYEDPAFEAYLRTVQQAIDNARQRPPSTGLEFLRRFEPSGNLAKDYGIEKCAYGY